MGWVLLSRPSNRYFHLLSEFVASPLMAECLALREAVLTCQRMKLRSMRFESDSAQLIKCLNAGGNIAEICSVVSNILSLVADFEYVSFGWISRERNMIADNLAKDALNVIELLVVVDAFIVLN